MKVSLWFRRLVVVMAGMVGVYTSATVVTPMLEQDMGMTLIADVKGSTQANSEYWLEKCKNIPVDVSCDVFTNESTAQPAINLVLHVSTYMHHH